VVQECSRVCQDLVRQAELKARVGTVALQNGNVGANTEVDCTVSPQCSEVIDTTSINILFEGLHVLPHRRGLKQATSVAWLQTVLIVTRELGTANWIVNQIRAGNLAPYINAFSAIIVRSFDENSDIFPQAVPPPSAAAPIANWPSPQAEWTGSCQVYGNCRAGGCASSCSNDLINRVSVFAGDADIACLCNLCGAVAGQVGLSTQYFFQTFECGTLASQAAANECCRNVMQDAVCWALHNDEVAVADKAAIYDGRWTYRAPSIGQAPPQLVRHDGPNDCPDDSSSSKGLLGLLGLLGIIPLALCCLSLLLCLLRRKKREGDVHFATFDPNMAGAGTLPMGGV